jgi:serine/threonine protein kinase
VIDELGKGQFGVVKLAQHITSGKKVAIKTVKKEKMSPIEVTQ